MISAWTAPSAIPAWTYAAGRQSGDASGIVLLVFAGLLTAATVIAAIYVRRHLRRSVTATVTARLFDELCRAHELSEQERSLLARAAAGTVHTAVVFVDPRLLERLGEAQPSDAHACGRLKERLFGA